MVTLRDAEPIRGVLTRRHLEHMREMSRRLGLEHWDVELPDALVAVEDANAQITPQHRYYTAELELAHDFASCELPRQLEDLTHELTHLALSPLAARAAQVLEALEKYDPNAARAFKTLLEEGEEQATQHVTRALMSPRRKRER